MRLKLLILVIAIASTTTFACDMHGQFGFGSFGNMHPLAQQHYGNSQQAITVKHPQKIATEAERPQSLSLTYSVPMTFTDARINITATDGIELLDGSEMRLTETNGQHELLYVVNKPGNHRITLSITGKGAFSSLAQSYKVQRIDITAF